MLVLALVVVVAVLQPVSLKLFVVVVLEYSLVELRRLPVQVSE